jgi:sigma-E factor negative regulatory protein RseC
MFKETGKIVEIRAGQAKIQLFESNACNDCSAKTACSILGGGTRIIQVPIGPSFHVNDLIELSFESSTRITSVVIVFLLPVFTLIFGLAISVIKYGDTANTAILGSLSGLFIGFVLVWLINKLLIKKTLCNPIIRKI